MAEVASAVRTFNRFWTKQMGLLDARLLDTPYSLTEARVIFELARTSSLDLLQLRRELGLDAGYMSRVVQRLERGGLVSTAASSTDGRRRVLALTESGRGAFADLNARAADQVEELLEGLGDEDKPRLVSAFTTVQTLLGSPTEKGSYVIRPARVGDYGWVIHRHGVLYAREYGWDESFEALVARVVADYIETHDPKREAAWIADFDGDPVGCIFCVREDDEVARLRLLLVDPKARGMGIGTRLVDEYVRFATAAGYRRVVLWTNDVLVSARRIYEAAGFRLSSERPHHSFGRDLVGQDWVLDLEQPAA